MSIINSLLSRRLKQIIVLMLVLSPLLIYFLKAPAPGLTFFDVGQGDGALISLPDGRQILIDGGPDNKILLGLGKQLSFFRRRLDYVVFSHFHADHIIGLLEILRRYEVGRLIYAPSDYQSDSLDRLFLLAQERGLELWPITSRATIDFNPDCRLSFLNPDSLGIKADENNSLSLYMNCRGLSALLTGDNDVRAEQAMLVADWPLRAEIFKAAHHGSKTANSLDFLQAVNPALVVISAGINNRFGHPHLEILQRLDQLNIAWQRTDQAGGVKIIFP